ncbi:MAG: hypothetical protein DGJ47_000426 [Rickettsiaceae bacterium]
MKLRIGSRKSKLAMIQTEMVIAKINTVFPDIECVIVPIMTTGDQITNKNLYDIGGKALFLKELEEKLLNYEIDIAVHSLKDVPGVLPKGLEVSAVLEREDPRDCFVSHKYKSIFDLPLGSVVGSSSVRRKVLINKMRPDLKIVQFRGNINTRLAKLQKGEVDATILACSGLKRAGLFNSQHCFPIDENVMLPAAGQGIICIENRIGDSKINEICLFINHMRTFQVAQAERGFLTYLDASCRTPMSAYAVIQGEKIQTKYMLSNIEGSKMEFYEELVDLADSKSVGINAAKVILNRFTISGIN